MSNFLKKVEIIPSDAGDSTRDTFKFVYDDDLGCPRATKTGTIDFQAYIDASKDSTDINLIVQRVNNGNLSPLHVMDNYSNYEDVTCLPSNMQELSKFADNLKGSFEKFPDDIKALFNNDYNDFVNSTINNTVNVKLSTYVNSKIDSMKNKEVVSDESSNS